MVLILLFFYDMLIINSFLGCDPAAYASFKAIETPTPTDDKQWLTYWTVIGFVHIIEYFSDILLFWIPFYFLFKTLFVLWLALPQTRVSSIYWNILYCIQLKPRCS